MLKSRCDIRDENLSRAPRTMTMSTQVGPKIQHTLNPYDSILEVGVMLEPLCSEADMHRSQH